ncbi:MAG: hotdog fold thioesterase [Microbacteriaceae bacterium]|nr:hotdog fold thioesterase [Microbacteriaceae bacterium]
MRFSERDAVHADEVVGEVINGHLVPDQDEVSHGRGLGELSRTMGMHLVRFSAEHSIAVMRVEGNTQPIGLLHGGAYCVLGESLGSMSANFFARTISDDHYAVGIDINATHTGSATSGWVTGECRAIHLGRSMTVHEIVITDGDGRRCSTVRITNLIRER